MRRYITTKDQLGQNIKRFREQKKMLQADLAIKLHLKSRTTISFYERGLTYPSIPHLIQMAEIFNIEVQELLLRDESIIQSDNSSTY